MTTIGLDVFARDRAAEVIARVGRTSVDAALRIQQANLRAERATESLARAEAQYGRTSLQAREAANRLALANRALQRSMNDAERATDEAARGTEHATSTMDRLRSGTAMAAGIAGTALALFAKKAVSAASDMEQATGGAQALFGKFSDQVISKSREAATAYGLSSNDYLTMSNQLGALLKNQGVAADQLASKTDQLIGVGSDLSAVYGGTAVEAVDALTSAFKGEFDPLQNYGITLSANTVQQELAAKGQDKLTGAALAQATQQAVTNLVMKQGGSALGQFAAQSGSMAEQTQIAQAQFANITAELGAKLLPVVTKGLVAFNDLTRFIQKNSEVIVPLVGGLAGLAAGIWAVNKASVAIAATRAGWASFAGILARVRASSGGVRGALGSLTGALGGPWMLAATAGVGILALWAKKQIDAKKRVEDLRGSLDQQTGAITTNSRAMAFKALTDGGAVEAAKTFGISMEDVTDAALGNAAAMARVRAAIDPVIKTYGAAATAQDRYGDGGGDTARQARLLNDALNSQNKELKAAQSSWDDEASAGLHGADAATSAAAATGDASAKLREQAAAAQKATEALRAHANALLEAEAGEDGYEAAVDDATKALKENGRTLDAGTDKGRTNRAALRTLATTTLAWADATKTAGGSQKAVTGIMADGRTEIIKMAEKFGMGKKAARAYADEILGIPKRHDTKVVMDTKTATQKAAQFRRQMNAEMNAISDEKVNINVRGMYTSSAAQGRGREMGDGPGLAPGHGGIGDGEGTSTSSSRVTPASSFPSAGAIRNAASDDVERIAAGIAKRLNASGGGGALGGGSAMGWRNQWAIIRRAFPWAHLNSAYRPGARTVSGNQSYHALGRAIDVTPSMKIFNWIRANYGRKTKELIYSPAGSQQLKNGRPHYYTGAVRAMHFNHVHWAMDKGGEATGIGWMPKLTSRPERVLSPRQTRDFGNLVQVLDRSPQIINQAGAGPDIDYNRLARSMAREFAGMSVQLDGRAVGRVQGQRADLIRRGG